MAFPEKGRVYQATFGIQGHDFQPSEPVRSDDPVKGHRINRGMFTSLTPEWATPTGVFLALDEKYHFTLDACATAENAKCERFFSREQDALLEEWTGSVFCNPPYGDGIGRWLRKAVQSSEKGATVVCLVPARTDTEWWHTYCAAGEILFIRGRLKFGDARDSAPFPSAVVIFEPPED